MKGGQRVRVYGGIKGREVGKKQVAIPLCKHGSRHAKSPMRPPRYNGDPTLGFQALYVYPLYRENAYKIHPLVFRVPARAKL